MIALDAVERYLDRASALIETVLCGVGRPLGVLEAARRSRVARSLIESSTMPAAMFGESGALVLANPSWRALFECGVFDAQLARSIEAVLHGREEIQHVPELAIDPAHRLAYCAATVRATRGSLGATTGAIVVCELITDHVVARELGLAADALIWSGQVGGEADYHNAAWVACTGEDTPWQAAIHADDRDRCLRALADARGTRTEADARIRCRSEERWHRLTFTASRTRWMIGAVDVHTQRTASQERAELLATALAARADAELANRRKDQFLAAVSHELRAPVTTMLLWDKVLRDEASDPPLRAQALDAIHDSAVAQARLVGDLLDIARAISGKLHVDLRAIDIERLVAEAVSGIESIAAARGLAVIATRSSPGIALVQGDAFRLRQVLDNLLSNAVKFSDDGATVSVVITSKRRAVTIAVSDTGRGISTEFLHRIFEPFTQSDEDGVWRSASGLGLGLAISKQLVELQGGSLTVASPGLGLGSTFTITLPAAGRASSPVLAPHLPTLRHRILVVDDDRRVLDALCVLLERLGAQVVTAQSAEDARQMIAAAEPDAVLCDIAMPGEDGYTFIKRLRGSGVRVPAIALTAHAMESDAARALAAGFDAHLAKPIDFDRLVAKIAQLIAASI